MKNITSVMLLLMSVGTNAVASHDDTPLQRDVDLLSDVLSGVPVELSLQDIKTLSSMSEEQILSAARAVVRPEPVYIGGARYTLERSNFTPIYETRFIKVIFGIKIPITYLTGLETSFAVDGDFGQGLFFDIGGRSSMPMTLSASCGSFNATDSGSKWLISKRQNTRGSCKHMRLKFSLDKPTFPNNFDVNLNIMISEQLN
ncbi:hypothetical protein N473_06320 [Pseudoalteromonas luteoviolacea CPMOR-1]|uniref:Secreted protein n=1 Tax=Pseudoalteromonas luteoviolacea CPMOR-1 TaxID=1365248 RepID=A0A161YC97_9GAMM|nr:hypothetical protein [Pseudoalteromonas luteoviolacea]KZN57496.1 hypothetical protein N473_06320 [Pseudoalteromonas luteoviolacea CPMOR-1]